MDNATNKVNEIYNNVLIKKRLDFKGFMKYIKRFEKTYYGGLTLLEIFSSGMSNGNCYDMSLQSLFCFDNNSYLIRGYLYDNNFHHGWIEFKDIWGRNFIFDTTFLGFYRKKDYYEAFDVTVDSKRIHKKLKESEYYQETLEDSKKPGDEYARNLIFAIIYPNESSKYLRKCEEIIKNDHPEFYKMFHSSVS